MATRRVFRSDRLRSERGQVLGLFVVWSTVILVMLALIINGGILFAKRRQAQRAADAGALAASAYLPATSGTTCSGTVLAKAQEYAITRNTTAGTQACTAPYNGDPN